MAERAVVSTTSLETQAKLLNHRGQPILSVPPEVNEAMSEQGMSLGGAFSPGEPIAPYQPVGTDPIITPYQVGQNIYAVPRGMTGVGFDTLRNITSKWDVARLCIEVRLDELRTLDWEIVVEDGADSDLYADELKAARRFFEHPSPGSDFDDLQMKSAEDWLRYDALCIARRRSKNGKLAELEAVDGTSIAPLIDGRGAMPRGAAPAYVQWAWGLPWTWLTNQDIIYKPHHPRPETRYGLAPGEWTLLMANTDLRLQWYFLTYFTEGEVPEAFVNAPPEVQDPKQVKALQDAYSAVMSGSRAAHHKVKWIPPGANVHTVNKGTFDVGYAGYMLAKGCAAWKVQPAEIGFTEKVNKSSGDTQADVTYRRSIKPTVKYFSSIWNRILREDLNMPYARFKYLNIEEEEDQFKLAQTRAVYIANAVISPDEVRAELGYDIDAEAPVGRSFATRTGVIFVDPESQKRARESGSLASQAGIEPTAVNPDEDDPNDDDGAQTPGALSPNQVIVDPALKPTPPKPGQPGSDQAAPPAPSKAVEDELRKWRQAAMKRVRDGKVAKAWQPSAIDPMLHRVVSAQLSKARSVAEVRDVFAPLIGGDAPPLAKRTARGGGKRGRSVTRDTKKRGEHQVALKNGVAKVLKEQGTAAATHIRTELEAASSEIATTNATTLDLILQRFGWQGWDAQLKAAVTPDLVELYKHGAVEAIKAAGGNPSWDLIDPLAVTYAESRAAELVGMKRLADGSLIENPNGDFVISDATRQMVKDQVVSALKAGSSPYELEQAIQNNYAFSDKRAETIARTETGFAYNHGSIGGYRLAGVSQVEVEDGEDFDDACAQANGQIWLLEDAEASPLEHPNCTRAFSPIVEGDED